MRHLDLHLLHTFNTIVECNSLSLAARRLHKTQAAVSIQLKKLEELVGRRLLDRGHQGAALTPDGERLLQYARRLLAVSEEALGLFRSEELGGVVRFGIPDDYASAFLRPVLQRFRERHPAVQLRIRNDISHHLFTALDEGELDLALLTQRNGEAGAELLRGEPLHWVAAPGFTLPGSGPLPLALYPHGCSYRQQMLQALTLAQRDYEIACECTGVTGVNLAVDSGLALTATIECLIDPAWRRLDAQACGLPPLGLVMIELRRARHAVSPAVEGFADELRRVVRQR
ncbi:LysR family transcriptional regulator [Pseudaquabacterium rugosum]|uniref:LysR substrate-binding domain-containing protein n=1 Tax=Pseudaquabacterium rugosum TaxID=2984194 RepID=A0ABU9BFV0_9BURK